MVIVVLLVSVCAVILALVATHRIQLTSHGVEFGGPRVAYVQKSDPDTTAFTNVTLNIPATWAQVTLEHGDSYGYAIKLPSATQQDLDCTVKNETLSVAAKNTHSLPDLDWTSRGYKQGKVVITVPRGVQFDAVQLNLAAGDYTIGDLSARQVAVNCPAGNVRLGQITASRVALSVQSGSMHSDGISTTTLFETVTAGELISLNARASVASLSVTTGELRFTGDASKRMTAKVTTGDAWLNLARPRNAYALISEIATGGLSINGRLEGQSYEINTELTQLNASVATGKAYLTFK
ncbi:MAG: DUF4097 domain-containing protein [Coriobacteriia bacterium]|nr:DUF4097 domain-containing protein [Coriobacteriia bacterium]